MARVDAPCESFNSRAARASERASPGLGIIIRGRTGTLWCANYLPATFYLLPLLLCSCSEVFFFLLIYTEPRVREKLLLLRRALDNTIWAKGGDYDRFFISDWERCRGNECSMIFGCSRKIHDIKFNEKIA